MAESGYSSSQIMAMQRDAIRRVNEMQRLSQEKLRQTQEAFSGQSMASAAPSQDPVSAGPSPVSSSDNSTANMYGMGGRPSPPPEPLRPMNNGPPGGHSPGTMGSTPAGGSSPVPPPTQPMGPEDAEPVETEVVPGGIAPSGLQGILQRMNLDSETIMLMMMLFLLVNEGADVMLILALVYILI